MELPSCDQHAQSGTLYVVATPIGNLSDITIRAANILNTVDYIACEDTRNTQKLLAHLSIKSPNPLIAYHEYNEGKQSSNIIKILKNGGSVALVSDAGTPTISDPGFEVVRACIKENLAVSPLPGACAFVCAASAMGIPTNDVRFVGFLPPKSAARKRFFAQHKETNYTLALYESCHRIDKFLNELIEELGDQRVIGIAREVTKKFETILVGGAAAVNNELKTRSKKGEFVVIIAPESYQL